MIITEVRRPIDCLRMSVQLHGFSGSNVHRLDYKLGTRWLKLGFEVLIVLCDGF